MCYTQDFDLSQLSYCGHLKRFRQFGGGGGVRQSATTVLIGRFARRTGNGISDRVNYCAIFMVITSCTNVAAGRITKPGGPLRVGDDALEQKHCMLPRVYDGFVRLAE